MPMPDNFPYVMYDSDIDDVVFAELLQIAETTEPIAAPTPHKAPPAKVDLSKYLHYIRKQAGGGCWGYARLAVWDIMNEMACPYSPNLSMNLWLMKARTECDRKWYLFNFPKKDYNQYKQCLKDGKVPDKLRNAFKAKKVLLPADAKISKINEKYWKIPCGVISYIIKDTGKELEIYIGRKGLVGDYSKDGRFHNDDEFFLTFGNTTEGTELTHHLWTGGWTLEGSNEAHNYRWASKPKQITVSSSEFVKCLAAGHPIRVEIPSHFVAIVGYDAANQTFKYVNSAGDNWGKDGFEYYTFSQIDNKDPIKSADIIKIITPRSVPAARISFTHTNRMNINLWLSVEDSPIPKRKIWPHLQPRRETHDSEWDDNSRNLSYTVRLPSELIWPPSPSSRLVLDLYDSGAFSDSGGELVEFTAAFGGHIVKCPHLSKAPASFKAREHRRFYIP